MTNIKIYVQSFIDLCLLLVATLADLDMKIRIVTGLVGIVLSVMTCIKIGQQIRRNAIDNKIKLLELKQKQAEDN